MSAHQPLYLDEHEDFRKTARTFYEREVVPHHEQWETDGIVPRELWRAAGEAGLLCFDVPEAYGGAGIGDFRFNVVLSEEQTRAAPPDRASPSTPTSSSPTSRASGPRSRSSAGSPAASAARSSPRSP